MYLSRVANILQGFDSHRRSNCIGNTSTPERPPRRTTAATTGPKLDHCLTKKYTLEEEIERSKIIHIPNRLKRTVLTYIRPD